MKCFLVSFISSIIKLNIGEEDLSIIFQLCAKLISNLKEFNVKLIEDSNGLDEKKVLEISSQFTQNSLFKIASKYKRNKIIESNVHYVTPKEVAIGTRWELQTKKFQTRIVKIPRLIQSHFQHISILGTLRSLFTHEEFARQYFEHNFQNQVCDTSKIINFCSGTTFKLIELFRNHPESVQLQLASDDFESCNPLGSKSNRHKICAVYLSIQNIPIKYLSKCKYVFLVALCNSDDVKMKHTDFNNIWYPIVNELKELESNGFAIPGKPNLKGTLTQLAFDNLGANTASGFVGSFSSNYFCRFCEMSKAECKQSSSENPNKLRTIEGYEKQVRIISESTKVIFDETKGAKYYCLLNDLDYFHIILVKQQLGFRVNHSCETTLNYVINKINCHIEENNLVRVVFLDLKRAFETVDRDILLKKMKEYGIQENEQEWFKSYLTNRKQQTKYNEIMSRKKEIDIGLPQGSALGPICFILYINDIVKAPKFGGIVLFADDTALIIKAKNIDEAIEKTNLDLVDIDKWLKVNKLMINVNKTKWMMINGKNVNITNQHSLQIANETIERVECIKYLGVQIDDKLTFEKHIQTCTNKIAKIVNLLYRIADKMDCNTKKLIYNAIITPNIEYCSTVFISCNNNDIEKLQIIQNRAMRIILKCDRDTPRRWMMKQNN